MTSDNDYSVCETISDGLAREMLNRLSCDEFHKVSLIVCKDVDELIALNLTTRNIEVERESFIFDHKRETWIEIMFLISRYDLLRSLKSCKVAAQEQIKKKTFFPLIKRMLLKVYGEMTKEIERQFRMQIGTMKLKATEEVDVREAPLSCLLCCFELHPCELRGVFKEMQWECMLNELREYFESLPDYVIDRTKDPIGLCLIVNNMTLARKGSEIDTQLLHEVFKGFGFRVNRYLDLSSSELTAELKRVAEMDHSDESVFVCCLMSHGCNEKFYCQNEEELSIKSDIIREFYGDRCPTLKGKPKLFFIQACRTVPSRFAAESRSYTKISDGHHDLDCSDAVSISGCNPGSAHKEADILRSYATVEGDRAVRYKDGSPYIKSLVDNLKRLGKTLDVLQILTKVNNDVIKNVCAEEGCQQPIFDSCLSKTLKLG